MADFMAKAERAYQRRQSELLFGSPNQMEFPTIQEDIDGALHADKQALVLATLPAISDAKRWRGTLAKGRRVFEAIVDEFGWQVLRKEYLAAVDPSPGLRYRCRTHAAPPAEGVHRPLHSAHGRANARVKRVRD